MALWGVGIDNDESVPKWLTDEEKTNVHADERGWIYVHPDGTEEVLVSARNLSDKLGAPTVRYVQFSEDSVEQGSNLVLNVYYNEGVSVSGTPIIPLSGITEDLSFDDGDSTPDEGHLVFSVDTSGESGTVTLDADSSIDLDGGTIQDLDGSTDAELSLNNDEQTAEITTS